MSILTFPLCCFGQILCCLPRKTPWKRIKINGFGPGSILPNTFLELQAEDTPRYLRCRRLRSDLTWYTPSAMWACNLLRTKHFHGVSSASRRVDSLNSQYGKVRIIHDEISQRKYWVVVASKEHVEQGKQLGIVQANHGKASPMKRMRPGDLIVFYSPKLQYQGKQPSKKFTAIARVKEGEVYQGDMGGGFEVVNLIV